MSFIDEVKSKCSMNSQLTRAGEEVDTAQLQQTDRSGPGIPAWATEQAKAQGAVNQEANEAKKVAQVLTYLNCAKDQYGDVVVRYKPARRNEVAKLDSARGQDMLRIVAKSVTGKTPNKGAIEILSSEIRMSVMARGLEVETFLRVGKDSLGRFCIDLGDVDGTCAVVDSGSWYVSDQVDVAFVRPHSFASLPSPIRPDSAGDALRKLWTFFESRGVPGNRILLVIAALVCYLKHGVAYPVLSFIGPAASGKSTVVLQLLLLFDPPKSQKTLPTTELTEEHIAATAQVRHGITADNKSSLSKDEQDTLCRCSTGGETYQRKLYTNGDVFILPMHRPIMITSVNSLVKAPDLMTRTVFVDLPARSNPETFDAVMADFRAQQGELFGALLELVAVSTVPIPNETSAGHRLVDFVLAGQRFCHHAGIDPQKFIQCVDNMRESTGAELAAGSAFIKKVQAVITDLAKNATIAQKLPGYKSWHHRGSCAVQNSLGESVVGVRPQQLFDLLCASSLPTIGWMPKDVKQMNDKLVRETPLFNSIGITVNRREPSQGHPHWEFTF
jgi:hypothetical protein